MNRLRPSLLFALIGILTVALFAMLFRQRQLVQRLALADIALAKADSVARLAEDARWYAERQRDRSDGILEDLKRAYPELERRAREIEAERNVALANAMEARQQESAKQVALMGEQAARSEEEAQRMIAEARADSIAREKRVSDNLRLRQRASVLAQNSMTVKGRPEFRALLAVYALRSMEMAGGDGGKDDLVLALHAALEELERPAPVRASGLKRPPHQMQMTQAGDGLLVMAHDGRLMRIALDGFKSSVVMDRAKELEPGTGRSFLSSDHGALILADPRKGLAAYSTTDGALVARSQGASGIEGCRAVASWPELNGLVTGDMNGLLQVWRREGERLVVVKERKLASAVRGLTYDAATRTVIALAQNSPLMLISPDGTFTEIALPPNMNGRCLASEAPGRVVVGAEQGSVVLVDLKNKEARTLHAGSGPRVEVIAASPASGRLVYANAVKELIVVDTKTNSSIRLPLTAIPGALAVGQKDAIYLAYGDRVERMFGSSRSMADRICVILERSWTPAEWKEIGGTGAPEPTCAGF